MTESCKWCEEELILPDDIDVIAAVCPSCGNVTGVCANCSWHGVDGHWDGDERKSNCDNCPFRREVK